MRSPATTRGRILLVQAYPEWRGPSSDCRLPLGMLYLGGSLRSAGYEVEAHHIPEAGIADTVDRLDLDGALFVGVCSVLTGRSLTCAISVSERLKQRSPTLPVVWGGAQASAIPELCLQSGFVDAVGIGEGEELILDIARVFRHEMDPGEVPGLAFKHSDGSVTNNGMRAPVAELDSWAPDFSLIDLDGYIFDGRVTGLLMSSRGCPYSCAFCYCNTMHSGRWRAHSPEYIGRQLRELLGKHDFNLISFSDDNFWVDKRRARKTIGICTDLGLRTFSVDVKINTVTEDDARFMAEHRVQSVSFGTESLNPRLIERINKRQTAEDVRRGIRAFAEHAPGVQVQTEILMALPFETEEEMRRDIQDGLDLYRLNRNLSLYFGTLFPLPGTPMMGYARDNGFCPATLDDYAELDLTMVWSIAHKWVPWMRSPRDNRMLKMTEAYSQIIELDRRPRSRAWRDSLGFWQRELLFRAAHLRIRHRFFLLHQLDFWLFGHPLWRAIPGRRMLGDLAAPFLRPGRRVRYGSFGHIPMGSRRRDLIGKLFGHRNFLKRLQARDIVDALDLRPDETALDFGCGAGYMTVEMAKLAGMTYGVDIAPGVVDIPVPEELENRLRFLCCSGDGLPFDDSTIDVVLASEVLPMVPDPGVFLREIRRVLRPGGRVVISNGAGHPAIREAYRRQGIVFRYLSKRYADRVPPDYETYCRALQEAFGTGQKGFLQEGDIRDLLEEAGFTCQSVDYTPGHLAGAYFSWTQFVAFLRNRSVVSQRLFPLEYFPFAILSRLQRRRYLGGLLCVAQKQGSSETPSPGVSG